MNDRREGAAGLGVADDVWLEAALHEALTGETPPDLRLRILRASPEQAAAAAAHVDAARAATASRPWWAAAAVLFGALVVGGVFALQRFGGAADAPAVVSGTRRARGRGSCRRCGAYSRSLHRQGHTERCPAQASVVDPDGATVGEDDLAADGEAKTDAVG